MHYVYLTLLVTLPLCAMDREESSSLVSSDEKTKPHIPHLSISIPSLPYDDGSPLKRINTMDALKQLRQSQKSSPDKKQPSPGAKQPSSKRDVTVTPVVAALVTHTVVYRQDPSKDEIKHLEKQFAQLEKQDPEKYNKLEQHILNLNDKYDGNISALGISKYKSQKYASSSSATNTQSSSHQTTPHTTSSSESPKHKVNSLMLEQSTLKKEMELQEKRASLQERELEDVRKEAKEMKDLMAQLTKQAEKDAKTEADTAAAAAKSDAAEANRISKRSLIVGSIISVLGLATGTTIGLLTLYYSNNNNSGHAGSCPNSTGT
jgi:hypothetical protein